MIKNENKTETEVNEVKIIREFQDKYYILKDSRISVYRGVNYRDTFWIECDNEGNVVENNPQTKNILCKIPYNCKDIDLSQLKTDCLYPEIDDEFNI